MIHFQGHPSLALVEELSHESLLGCYSILPPGHFAISLQQTRKGAGGDIIWVQPVGAEPCAHSALF
jgi:hypothetical protein